MDENIQIQKIPKIRLIFQFTYFQGSIFYRSQKNIPLYCIQGYFILYHIQYPYKMQIRSFFNLFRLYSLILDLGKNEKLFVKKINRKQVFKIGHTAQLLFSIPACPSAIYFSIYKQCLGFDFDAAPDPDHGSALEKYGSGSRS